MGWTGGSFSKPLRAEWAWLATSPSLLPARPGARLTSVAVLRSAGHSSSLPGPGGPWSLVLHLVAARFLRPRPFLCRSAGPRARARRAAVGGSAALGRIGGSCGKPRVAEWVCLAITPLPPLRGGRSLVR